MVFSDPACVYKHLNYTITVTSTKGVDERLPLARTKMSSPSIRGLLIDLSGTLHIGSTAIPGAVQALQRLRASGIPFRFCSNTSKESTSSLCRKLRQIGFDIPQEVEREEVWTSIGAVRQLLQDRGLKRFVEFSLHLTVSLIGCFLLPQAVLAPIGLCEGGVRSGIARSDRGQRVRLCGRWLVSAALPL